MSADSQACMCGLYMIADKRRPNYRVCPNCDTIQPVQYEAHPNGTPKSRVKTEHDHRFALGWKRRCQSLGL